MMKKITETTSKVPLVLSRFTCLFFPVPRVRCKLLKTFIVPLNDITFNNHLLKWTFSEIPALSSCLLSLTNLHHSESCPGLMTYDLFRFWFIT